MLLSTRSSLEAWVVDSLGGPWGGRETDLAVCSVVNGVETFEECEAVDEVQTLAAGGSNITDDEVDAVVVATDLRVEGTRPGLSVGGKRVCLLYIAVSFCSRHESIITTHPANLEVEVLELAELGRRELEKTSGLVG